MNKYNIDDYVEIKGLEGVYGGIFQIQEISSPLDSVDYLYSVLFSQIGVVYHAFESDIISKIEEPKE